MTEIQQQLHHYLTSSGSPYLRDATNLEITAFARMPEGWSRECFMFTLEWKDAGGDQKRDLILRRDPAGSLVYTDRLVEAGVIRALAGTPIPVPNIWALETDDAALGSPFMIMERLSGTSSPAVLYAADNAENRRSIGRDFVRHLATLHSLDLDGLELPFFSDVPTVDTAGEASLLHWERTMAEQQLEPQPFLAQATRWLRNHMPVAPRVSLLHGDYRTGNFLFADDHVTGVVDWELSRLGDPLEDLGWVFKNLWRLEGRICGFFERDEFIELYEEYSGITVDREALHFWEVFAEYKHSIIGLTGTRTAVDRKTDELNFSIAHLYLPPLFQEQAVRIGI
jgi:aminoglycoside phosphotransferase (APT) family kinase protein